MNAIVKHGFDSEQVKLIKQTIMAGKDPSDAELALFGMVCRKSGLDPFAKQVFAIQRGGKWSFDISIDGYRAIADRTGLYAGSDEPLYDEGLELYEFEQSSRPVPTICKVVVWKIVQGTRCPFVGVAKYSEFNSNSPLWKKMPCQMLAVAAERQALRKAFPQCVSVESAVGDVVEAVDVTADEQWRVDGYQWGISQGVSPETAAEIAKVAKDKKDLAQRLKSAIPEAVEVATLQRQS
jgi:phage recombination protein Bet